MDVIHITETKNVKSIMGSKIFRNKPILSQYDKVMYDDYGFDYDRKKGLVFGFPESIRHRDKMIKDFAYWKTWGDVRNKFLLKYNGEEYDKSLDIGPKVFSHLKLKSTYFSIILLDVDHEKIFCKYTHEQSSDMGPLWIDMETRYEHNDKPLVLMNYDINSNKIKRVIGTIQTIVTKKNKINTLLDI